MNIYTVYWKAGWMESESSEQYDSESMAYEAFVNLKEDFRDESEFYCFVEHSHVYTSHYFDIEDRDED